PFDASGRAELRITNIRVNATFAPSGQTLLPQPVIVRLGMNPATALAFPSNTLEAAFPDRGLFATSTRAFVPNHAGSILPEQLTFANLISKGNIFFSTRVTEGFQSSFEGPSAASSQGTRVMLHFSVFPFDVWQLVPNGSAGC